MQYVKKNLKLVVMPVAVAAMAIAATLGATASAPPNLDRALEAQLALAVERPTDPQVLNDLGNLLLLAERPEEAEDAYRRALELAPDSTSVRYNLGLLLQQLGRPRAALDQLEQVLEREPRNAWAYYQVGRIHDALGHDRRAVRHYAAAFALDPNLAFPEVNPQVIDNRHLTEAMLVAYRDAPSLGEVPKTYAEPGRIVSLMVPPEAVEAPAEIAEPDAEPAEGPGMRPRPALAPSEGEAAAGAQGGRTLSERDLDADRGLNQAQPSAGTPRYRGGTRIDDGRTVDPQGRVRPSPPRYTPPSAGRPGGFQTGPPSTGRLDTRLVPEERVG